MPGNSGTRESVGNRNSIMTEENITTRNNPHDKLFKETWSDLANVRSFLDHYLPANVSGIMDFDTLEISKDSFVEKELEEYFSDMLYKVKLSGTSGYVYVLFEHKSYHEKHIHLQLLEYMVKIWRLCLKQDKKASLPVVIPLLLCHGRYSWPEKKTRFSSMLSGPPELLELLSEYIPDFSYTLYDLTRFSDGEIKGTVMVRVMMMLFKYISEPDFMKQLPDIISLMQELMEKETGLQYLETVLRYLFSTVDSVSTETIKTIVGQALSDKEGDFIMTLTEKLHMEGEKKGKKEGIKEGIKKGIKEGKKEGVKEGLIEGLRQAIELGISLKFPDKVYAIMLGINKINNTNVLINIKDTIRNAKDDSEIMVLLN